MNTRIDHRCMRGITAQQQCWPRFLKPSSPQALKPTIGNPECSPAIFLDRDGTMNVDVGYLHRIEQLELFPWPATPCACSSAPVTRSSSSPTRPASHPRDDRARLLWKAAHAEMQRRLESAGTRPRRVVFLPARPARVPCPASTSTVAAASPFTGMIDDAARDLGIDVSPPLVGDRRQVARRPVGSQRQRQVDPRANRLGRANRKRPAPRASAWRPCATI